MDWRNTPIFITNLNRLDVGFKEQINWWLDVGMTDINVLDDGSTYPPLLDFYNDIKHDVKITVMDRSNLDQGRAPWSFWDLGIYKEYLNRPVIINDSDCSPSETCPKDLIPRLYEVLDQFPDCKIVSPKLRFDDIPEHYAAHNDVLKDDVVRGEYVSPGVFKTHVDTILALRRNGDYVGWNDVQLSIDEPYTFRHRPWYSNTLYPTEEEIYYREHLTSDRWQFWKNIEAERRRECESC